MKWSWFMGDYYYMYFTTHTSDKMGRDSEMWWRGKAWRIGCHAKRNEEKKTHLQGKQRNPYRNEGGEDQKYWPFCWLCNINIHIHNGTWICKSSWIVQMTHVIGLLTSKLSGQIAYCQETEEWQNHFIILLLKWELLFSNPPDGYC